MVSVWDISIQSINCCITKNKNRIADIYDLDQYLESCVVVMLQSDPNNNLKLTILMEKLNFSESELNELIKEEKKKYPHISSDEHAIYMIAKEQNLQFSYDQDTITGLTTSDPELDVDLNYFLE